MIGCCSRVVVKNTACQLRFVGDSEKQWIGSRVRVLLSRVPKKRKKKQDKKNMKDNNWNQSKHNNAQDDILPQLRKKKSIMKIDNDVKRFDQHVQLRRSNEMSLTCSRAFKTLTDLRDTE